MMTEKTYTEAEAMLMADRATMRVKMDEMAHRIESTERATRDGFTEVKSQIGSLATSVEKQMAAEDVRRAALKTELAKEFATKLEVQQISHKVDNLWIKISSAVAAVIAVGMFIQYILMTTDKVRTILGH